MKFAIVTQSMAPWLYESSLILGLPRGSYYRARFKNRWINDEIRSYFLGKREVVGIICVRDWKTANIIPIRNIKTKNVQEIGEYLHIEYEVTSYIDYAALTEQLETQLEQFNSGVSKIFESKGWENIPDGIMKPLVFPLDGLSAINTYNNDERDKQKYDYNQWLLTVEIIKKFPDLFGMPFLKFSIRDSEENTFIEMERGKYRLYRNREYVLSVFHYLFENTADKILSDEERTPRAIYMENGPYLASFSTSGALLKVSPQTRYFSGRYDQLNFVINMIQKDTPSSETLMMEFSIPEDIKKSFSPIFEIPILIRDDLRFKIFRAIFILIFIGLFVFFSYSESFVTLIKDPIKSLIEDFALVIFAFQAIDLVGSMKQVLRKL